VLKLLLELNHKEGTTLLLVTHDATLAECADGGLCCATV